MINEDGTIGRRELLSLSLWTAGTAITARSRAASALLESSAPAADLLPAKPKELPVRWRDRADAFDRYVMNRANEVLQTHSDGLHYFASALEGDGDGGLTTFAPIVLGKILRGDAVDWLAPSMAAYYSDRYGVFLDGRHAASCEYWYLMNVNALAGGVVRRHMSQDPVWRARVRNSADRLIALAHQLNYDFNDQGYRFDSGLPWTKQDIYRQPDAIGGYGYLMLLAHEMFGGAQYLAEAKEALRRYLSFPTNPWYEVPSGAMACLAAARLSVADPAIDVGKALGFVLDAGGRPLQTGKWGADEVGGLMAGFRTEPAGEAYSMESLMTAGYLLPVLRYCPEFATIIGRYLLNAAANMRLFYSDCIGPQHQSRPDLTSAVPYERLSRSLGGKSPYASGDYGSHRSIYGGAYALWWGELMKPTAHPHILQMDVTLTDFLEQRRYPTYLYYNPLGQAAAVALPAAAEESQVYDLTAHAFLDTRGRGRSSLTIPAKGSRVIVIVPAHARCNLKNGTLYCGDVVVEYAPRQRNRGARSSIGERNI